MPPLPGSPPPNAPGTGSPAAPVQATVPNPLGQHPMGARVPTGLPYGEHQQLAQAEKALPIGGQAARASGGQATGHSFPTGGLPAGVPIDHPAVLEAAKHWTPPVMDLAAPTNRPFEPVTAGASAGPGPGPEILQNNQPANPTAPVSSILSKAAQAINSDLLAQSAQRAAMAGQ